MIQKILVFCLITSVITKSNDDAFTPLLSNTQRSSTPTTPRDIIIPVPPTRTEPTPPPARTEVFDCTARTICVASITLLISGYMLYLLTIETIQEGQ